MNDTFGAWLAVAVALVFETVVISICDKKPIKNGSCNPFNIKTDMSDFSRLLWAINLK